MGIVCEKRGFRAYTSQLLKQAHTLHHLSLKTYSLATLMVTPYRVCQSELLQELPVQYTGGRRETSVPGGSSLRR